MSVDVVVVGGAEYTSFTEAGGVKGWSTTKSSLMFLTDFEAPMLVVFCWGRDCCHCPISRLSTFGK
jgi:hypothetical protein